MIFLITGANDSLQGPFNTTLKSNPTAQAIE